jgi:hypothetical protein
MNVPKLVVTWPNNSQASFPLIWSDDAYMRGRTWVGDWIVTDAIDSHPMAKTLADEYGSYLAEYFNSALHEGGERSGEYEHCDADWNKVYGIKWHIEGDMSQYGGTESGVDNR